VSPSPAKLTRIAEALGLSGANVYALADYLVPTHLPSPRPYLGTKYRCLLGEDIDRMEELAARAAKRRRFNLAGDGAEWGAPSYT
jgi:hypothetical protein